VQLMNVTMHDGRYHRSISISPPRPPNLRAVEDDSGERDRYQQLCVLHFLVSRALAAKLLRLVHPRLDLYYIALPPRFVDNMHERTSAQSCIYKVVSVPVPVWCTGGPRVFVNQLNAHNLVGCVSDQVQPVKMSFEVTVLCDVREAVPWKAWRGQPHA
jgi:hypothetical protein